MSEEQTTAPKARESPPSERRGLRFTLRQLFVGIAVVAILLGIWVGWIRKVVTIRPAGDSDPVRGRYFGIDDENANIRNIAVANGTFTKSTWLSASLSAVQGGQVQELNAFTVGRSPNQIGSLPWEPLKITLALGSWDTPNGTIVQLGSVGFSRGTGRSGEMPVSIPSKFSSSFEGSITPGREYIIYAEGDARIVMSRDMTVAEFAQSNAGNYLVVTAQLH